MNEAEAKKNRRIFEMRDVDLLKEILSDAFAGDLDDNTFSMFVDMLEKLQGPQFALSIKQRLTAEEVARRIFPINLKDVPKGKPVEEPAALKHRPLKPPGRK